MPLIGTCPPLARDTVIRNDSPEVLVTAVGYVPVTVVLTPAGMLVVVPTDTTAFVADP